MKRLSALLIACCAAAVVMVAHLDRATPDTVTKAEIQVPCSSEDSTAAWNTAISQAINGSDKIVHLFACDYHFYSAPAPISHGIEVLGQGLYSTFLERDYSPGHGVREQPVSSYRSTTSGRPSRIWRSSPGPARPGD